MSVSSRWPGDRSVVKRVGLLAMWLTLVAAVLAAGCGGDSSDADSDATTSTETEEMGATTEPAADMSGSELGEAAAGAYAEAMQELNAMLADQPDPADVTPDVEALKEEYVQRMVELGRQRETLDDAGRAEMDATISSALFDASEQEWFATYQEIYEGYFGGDADFTNLLASFNILTQYANFELLTQQDPEEAARLGVE